MPQHHKQCMGPIPATTPLKFNVYRDRLGMYVMIKTVGAQVEVNIEMEKEELGVENSITIVFIRPR